MRKGKIAANAKGSERGQRSHETMKDVKLGKAKKQPKPGSQKKESHNDFWRSIPEWWQIVKLWYFGVHLKHCQKRCQMLHNT
jgi:hypothetical protein